MSRIFLGIIFLGAIQSSITASVKTHEIPDPDLRPNAEADVNHGKETPLAGETSWPCPPQTGILPCTCETDNSYNIIMDCSDVTSEDELANAFNVMFPFDDVDSLTINNAAMTNDIQNLTSGIFQTKSFRDVMIVGTNLERIADDVFSESHQTLLNMNFYDNKLSVFPYETLSLYNLSTTLNLDDNQLTVLRNIESLSIRGISLNHNQNLVLIDGKDTFSSLPNLVYIGLVDTGRSDIPQHLFSQNKIIEEIYLSDNSIQSLDINSINPPNPSLIMLYLDNNQITSVANSSISGTVIT